MRLRNKSSQKRQANQAKALVVALLVLHHPAFSQESKTDHWECAAGDQRFNFKVRISEEVPTIKKYELFYANELLDSTSVNTYEYDSGGLGGLFRHQAIQTRGHIGPIFKFKNQEWSYEGEFTFDLGSDEVWTNVDTPVKPQWYLIEKKFSFSEGETQNKLFLSYCRKK